MKKPIIKTIYTDHLIEDLRGYWMPLYIQRICKAINLDTGEEFKIKSSDKEVYGYLCGVGQSCGWNSIYPTIDQMTYNLGLTKRTISSSIKQLKDVGMIKVGKHRSEKGVWENNTYKVLRPNMIQRTIWIDINGNILKGRNYDFNTSQFKKSYKDLSKDKMLRGYLYEDKKEDDADECD